MTSLDDAKQEYEQVMEQFKGQRFKCVLCGMEGEYDKDLYPGFTTIGKSGFTQGAEINYQLRFHCKDSDACQRRQQSKEF
jgi:hypothetical protein